MAVMTWRGKCTPLQMMVTYFSPGYNDNDAEG